MTTEYSIAQTIVYFYPTYTFFLNKLFRGGNGFLHLHTVQIQSVTTRIYHFTFFGIETFFRNIAPFYQRYDGQVEMFGESVVPTIVCRYGHDSSCPVSGQDIIAYIDRYMFIVQRIDSICTSKHTSNALVHESLTLGTMFYTVQIFVYSFLLIGGDYLFYIIAFGSQYHKSNPENRIGTRRKYGKLHIGIHHLKLHFGSLGTTYPVLLGLFKRICPIYFIQTFQQTLSVCRYP